MERNWYLRSQQAMADPHAFLVESKKKKRHLKRRAIKPYEYGDKHPFSGHLDTQLFPIR